MVQQICEVCGCQIHAYDKHIVTGAISVLAKAHNVCADCDQVIKNTDWSSLCRREIMRLRIEAKMDGGGDDAAD